MVTRLDDVIRSIICDFHEGRLVLFLGAGVSIPSGVPGAIGLTNHILYSVCMRDEGLRKAIFPAGSSLTESPLLSHFRNVEEELFSPRAGGLKQTLRLEVVLEVLYESFGVKALECLLFMAGCAPSSNHRFAAECYAQGCSIITTNFDTAVEDAIKEKSIEARVITAADSDYSPMASPFLLKLHGDIGGLDTLGATISNIEDGLPPSIQTMLKRFLPDKHLVFLGYSGSDHFDISPFLLEIPVHRVTWVSHCQEKSFLSVADKSGLLQSAPSSSSNPTFNAELIKRKQTGWGWLVTVNTDVFRDELASLLFGRAVDPETSSPEHDWVKWIQDWSRTLNPALAAASIGRLAQQIGLVDVAEECYQAMRSSAEYISIEPIKRASLELNEEYLLSVRGRYKAREQFLRSFRRQWRSAPIALSEDWSIVELQISGKLASCRIFDDQMFSAAWCLLMTAAHGFGWWLKHRESRTSSGIARELHQLGTELNFMLRIFPRRWFFTLPGWFLKLLRNGEKMLMNAVYLVAGKGGMANKVRVMQYSGRTELQDILGAPRYYLELENLLGLTNTLREAALERVLRYKECGSIAVLREAEGLLRKSIFISREIGDSPGVAKGYHHLCWIDMKLSDTSDFEQDWTAAEHYLRLVEAPLWVKRRIQDLQIWRRRFSETSRMRS